MLRRTMFDCFDFLGLLPIASKRFVYEVRTLRVSNYEAPDTDQRDSTPSTHASTMCCSLRYIGYSGKEDDTVSYAARYTIVLILSTASQ